jgi:hypothetical protein
VHPHPLLGDAPELRLDAPRELRRRQPEILLRVAGARQRDGSGKRDPVTQVGKPLDEPDQDRRVHLVGERGRSHRRPGWAPEEIHEHALHLCVLIDPALASTSLRRNTPISSRVARGSPRSMLRTPFRARIRTSSACIRGS